MARYVPPSSTPAKAATPRTSDEYEWEMAEWESYGGKKPRAPTSTEKNLWAAAELEANPRSRADYMLELKDAEDFGNPKPLPPTVAENTMWAEELAAEEADRKSAASKQYATRAEGQARTPERLKGLRDVLGRGRPLLTTLSPEVRADAKSASDTIARADFYRDKPEKLVSKQFKGEVTAEVLDRIRSDLDANAAQARQNLASLGLDPGQKVPVTRAIQRPTLTPAEVLGITTQPEPAVADTPKKPRAKPMVGTTPRSKNSIPRLQGELFGIPPVEYGPYIPPVPEVGPVPTMGGDFGAMYRASGGEGRYPTGMAPGDFFKFPTAGDAYDPFDGRGWQPSMQRIDTGGWQGHETDFARARDFEAGMRMAADRAALERESARRDSWSRGVDPDAPVLTPEEHFAKQQQDLAEVVQRADIADRTFRAPDGTLNVAHPGLVPNVDDNWMPHTFRPSDGLPGGLPREHSPLDPTTWNRPPVANTDRMGLQSGAPGPRDLGRSGASANAETFGVRSPITATHHLGRSGFAANQSRMAAPSAGLAALGISAPQGGGDGGGGTLARPPYPVALDRPGMVLNRPALGYGGMEFVERVPPAALGAPPMQPPPPAAPGAPGMMSRAGNALLGGAQYLGGVLARTAPVLDVALPGILDHDAEVAATMRAMQSQVGGGRGMMPASAYPAGMEAMLGVSAPAAPAMAPNSRGQGFADPRLVRRPAQAAAPVRRPVRAGPVASPWVPMAMDPSVLMQTPVVNSPLPVGNANIDDETRRRAYRAMGLLP